MDWVHFTTLESVDICKGLLALVTNARAYAVGMKAAFVLCGARFFAKDVLMLNQHNPQATLEGDVLGRIKLAPAIIFRELLHVAGRRVHSSDGYIYTEDKCKLLG